MVEGDIVYSDEFDIYIQITKEDEQAINQAVKAGLEFFKKNIATNKDKQKDNNNILLDTELMTDLPRRGWDEVLSKDTLSNIMLKQEDLAESSRRVDASNIRSFFKLFNETENILNIFKNNSKAQIVKAITDKYKNPERITGSVLKLIEDIKPEISSQIDKQKIKALRTLRINSAKPEHLEKKLKELKIQRSN